VRLIYKKMWWWWCDGAPIDSQSQYKYNVPIIYNNLIIFLYFFKGLTNIV